MKQGFIIPVYRHGRTAVLVVRQIADIGIPIILVDDGNAEDDRNYLENCAKNNQRVVLLRLEKNSGKGGAFTAGIKKAKELGLTHVLQIDADGQHDSGRVKFFLEASKQNPDKIICGYPEFDSSAPKSRVIGRKISVFWAAVVTLSSDIKDSHCGFRVYPVEASLKSIKNIFFDKRMGFDSEIIIRLYWKNVLPEFHNIKVTYPHDGISNFRLVRDNIRISWMFTRLFFGMLFRLPVLIFRKIKKRKNSD